MSTAQDDRAIPNEEPTLSYEDQVALIAARADPETGAAFDRIAAEAQNGSGTMTPHPIPEWDEPDPLPGGCAPDEFPLEALGSVRSFVEAVAEETGTPTDLASVAVMGITSSLIAGAVVVEGAEGHHESVNIYVACLASPGEGKTPVMKRCRSVMEQIEADRHERVAPEIREAESMRKVAEARLREAVTRASKAAKPDALEAEEEVREATRELAAIQVPAYPRLYTREVTPEGLVKLLGEQGGRVGVVTDEGVEFFEMASRYSGNGKGNLGIYLDGFDGNRFASDRAGRESIIIDRTTLTVCLFAQPVVLETLAQDRQAAGRGLLARFLWSKPGSLVGQRRIGRPSVPAALLEAYEGRMIDLAAEAEAVTSEPLVLRLDGAANDLFLSWWARHEPRLLAGVGDLSGVVDWANKLPGQTLRLAGIIHALSGGSIRGSINAETMTRALSLTGYFTSHALAVFGAMQEDPVVADARAVLAWLEDHHPTRADPSAKSVTLRDIYRSKKWDKGRVERAVWKLADHGWVRRVEREDGATGRPSDQWDVYPNLVDRRGQNPPLDKADGVLSEVLSPSVHQLPSSDSAPLTEAVTIPTAPVAMVEEEESPEDDAPVPKMGEPCPICHVDPPRVVNGGNGKPAIMPRCIHQRDAGLVGPQP